MVACVDGNLRFFAAPRPPDIAPPPEVGSKSGQGAEIHSLVVA